MNEHSTPSTTGVPATRGYITGYPHWVHIPHSTRDNDKHLHLLPPTFSRVNVGRWRKLTMTMAKRGVVVAFVVAVAAAVEMASWTAL